MANDLAYPIVIAPVPSDEGGGYMAYAPDLMGCVSDGVTPEEAATNLREAIGEWIEEATRLGRRIPAPGDLAKKAAREKKALFDLIAQQDKAIKQQSEALQDSKQALNALEHELDSIKEVVKDLLESEECHEIGGGWLLAPPLAVLGRPKRGSDGDMPH